MSKNKINVLTNDLAGFFTNTSENFYDYNKQRNMTCNQRVMYHDTKSLFQAMCLSFYKTNTPATAGTNIGGAALMGGMNKVTEVNKMTIKIIKTSLIFIK